MMIYLLAENIINIESGVFLSIFYFFNVMVRKYAPIFLKIIKLPEKISSVPPWFDYEWYLSQYPDVKKSAMDPWFHYCNHGKKEGRLPCKNMSAAFENALWRGAHSVAVIRLHQLLDDKDRSEFEINSARYVLARWYLWKKDYKEVIDLLAPICEFDEFSDFKPYLVLTDAICRFKQNGQSLSINYENFLKYLLFKIKSLHPIVSDIRLARSNILLYEKSDDDLRLKELNLIYEDHSLPGLVLIDYKKGLSLDNIAGDCEISRYTYNSKIVSIIIPLYNSESTIATTLNGLFSQTWPFLEIIIVDDCSTDNSLSIVRSISKKCPDNIKIKIICHDVNRGAYSARNTGLAASTGDFITVHDSDDWSHPVKIQKQVEFLIHNENIMASLSWLVRVKENLYFHRWRVDEFGWIYPNISSLMFRREVYFKIGYWDEVYVSADTEYRERIEAAFGQGTVSDVLPGIPLSFCLNNEKSLSQNNTTHLSTAFSGVRYHYMRAAREWHVFGKNNDGLYLGLNQPYRPFLAPHEIVVNHSIPVVYSKDKDFFAVSDIFNSGWFLERYINLQFYSIDPFEHFWHHARAEGLDPNPDFSTSGYLRLHPDAAAFDNPLAHLLQQQDKVQQCLPVWHGQPMRPKRPTLMVCGHLAGKRLFGAERSLLDMLVALSASEFNLIVTLPEAMNAEYEQQILSHAQALAILPYGWWQKGRIPVTQTVQHFGRLMERFDVDVLHVNTLVLDEPLRAARERGIPTLVHVRELPATDKALCDVLGASAKEIVQHAIQLADRLVANSRHTAAELSRITDTQCPIDIVPNSLDMTDLLALPEVAGTPCKAALRVGMLSSHVPKKGLADIERLAVHLHQRGADVELILFGPETEPLQTVLDSAAAQGAKKLKYGGYVAAPAEALVSLDVVINLSHFQESFGRTVLEAMAAARPVVAYEWGALPELVEHDKTGFMAPLGDVSSVAGYLERLARDRELCREMGRAGRARAQQAFGYAAMAERLAHVYRQAGIR